MYIPPPTIIFNHIAAKNVEKLNGILVLNSKFTDAILANGAPIITVMMNKMVKKSFIR
jgi:hypothetical protein